MSHVESGRPGGRGGHIDVEEVHLTMLRHLPFDQLMKGLVPGSPYGMNICCAKEMPLYN